MKQLYISGVLLGILLISKNAYCQTQAVPLTLESIDQRVTKTEIAVKSIDDLNIRQSTLSKTLGENSEAVKNFINADLFSDRSKYELRAYQIINTAACTDVAHRSLAALGAAVSFSTYMGTVVALNSPSNTELGLSLSKEITQILNTRIFKNPNKKVNGTQPSKVLKIVQNVVDHPIVTSVASAFPVVNSIRSVVDLISGVATRGDDVTIDDLALIKLDLKKYLDYYQGLADANTTFSSKIDGLQTRIQALNLILGNSVIERLKVIQPDITISDSQPIYTIINNDYNSGRVKSRLDAIFVTYHKDGVHNYRGNLDDPRIFLAEGTISHVRYIKDEIETIDKTYWSSYDAYQADIEKVLNSAKANGIGNANEIDKKISSLRLQLQEAKKQQTINVNLEFLRSTYNELARGITVDKIKS